VFAPDENVVRDVLGRQFGELAQEGIEFVGEGWDCVAYRCGRWVFRFPRRPLGVSTLSTEARVLPQLGREVLLGRESPVFPYLFLGTKFQSGMPLEKYGGPRTRLATELGTYLAQLHASTMPQAVPDDPGKLDIPRRRDQIKKHLGRVPAWVPTRTPAQREVVLLHGDVYCRHIYVSTDGHLEDLIDWGDLSKGHRTVDLGCAWCCFGAADRERFWDAYGRPSEEILVFSRFRALYHSLLVRHYATVKGFTDLLSETEDALHRILY
jgi:aminoglycoside phosphotransferase (APT) family kinase protein